ncbi:hypothetical protein [Acinetobacter towneri]|uniref:hypothetical protein n=1 Tax=Acinetobacter towneri TaxID=202956 RepID=UPI00257863FF|nr:hypothetical protein [Acinetobacter towneri]MDM1722557.1 hypothetical protein [Acinetobacter towneri]
MKKKEISLKFSAVALAVLLVGCGGGGSDGYYNKGVSAPTAGTGTGSQEENLFKNIQIQYLPIVEKLNARGDTFTVSVRVMNDGAILPNVVLKVESIDVAKNKAAIEYISSELADDEVPQIKTDGQGIARFNIKVDRGLDESTINEILKGIKINVSYIDEKGNNLASAPLLIQSFDPDKQQPILPVSKYDWSILTDKQALAVTDDKINVQVRLKAINTSDSVSNKPVQILLENFTNQFEIINNTIASTNNDGYVAFTISSKNISLSDQDIATMLSEGLKFKVQVIEQGIVTSQEQKTIDLVKYIDESLNGGIKTSVSFGELKASGNNYIQQVEFSLGEDNANKDVTVASRALQYSKGKYYFSNNIGLYPLSSVICTLNNSPVKNETGLDWAGKPITYTTLVSEKLSQQSLDVNNVVYLNKAGLTGSKLSFVKIKTDNKGKAIIDLVYDKGYSKWLNLSLSVRVENQSVPFGITYDFQLPLLESDYNDQDGSGPNMISPFGISDDCFNAQ